MADTNPYTVHEPTVFAAEELLKAVIRLGVLRAVVDPTLEDDQKLAFMLAALFGDDTAVDDIMRIIAIAITAPAKFAEAGEGNEEQVIKTAIHELRHGQPAKVLRSLIGDVKAMVENHLKEEFPEGLPGPVEGNPQTGASAPDAAPAAQ